MSHLQSRLPRPRAALLALLALAVVGLAGCGGAPPATSWPGVTIDGDTAYVAFNQHVYAVMLSDASATKKWQWPAEAGRDSFYGDPALAPDGLMVIGSYNLGHVYGLDAASGSSRWEYTPPSAQIIPGLPVYRPGGQIVAGAAVTGGVAYVPFNNGQLHAVQTAGGTGRLLFSTADQNGLMATPVIAAGTLYLTSLGHDLLALDPAAGTLHWALPAGGPIAGGVSLAGGTVLIGTFGQEVVAVDAASGALRWRVPVDEWVWGTPQVYSDTIYAATLAGSVYALDLNGTVLWQQSLRTLAKEDRPAVRAALLVSDDSVYAVTRGGWLYALERAGGVTRWSMQAVPGNANVQLLTQPRLWRANLLVALMGGDVPLLQLRSAKTGDELWSFKP